METAMNYLPKMDAKSTNLIEHVQRNKPADQVSLHSIVSRPLSFNKLLKSADLK